MKAVETTKCLIHMQIKIGVTKTFFLDLDQAQEMLRRRREEREAEKTNDK